MRRIRITISYDGTDFHGWQVQPGLPSVQSALEKVVSEIEESPVRVETAGRTDAGVHALAHSKVRTIFSSRLTREGDLLVYRVRGSGFLKHMVRNVVGVLMEAGKGNLSRADLEARLRPGCTIPTGPTAPARGLFLVGVE